MEWREQSSSVFPLTSVWVALARWIPYPWPPSTPFIVFMVLWSTCPLVYEPPECAFRLIATLKLEMSLYSNQTLLTTAPELLPIAVRNDVAAAVASPTIFRRSIFRLSIVPASLNKKHESGEPDSVSVPWP